MGLTVVIVTHELESIFKIASRGIMLDKESKSIIAEGDPKELAKSDDPRVFDFPLLSSIANRPGRDSTQELEP